MSLPASHAIVFNCGYNGLGIIQDLGRRGVKCHAMDSVRSIGTFSRYASFVRCPDPSTDETRFVDFLYDYCTRLSSKPVLFPTNDHWAMAVSRHMERLAEVSFPCVSDWQALRLVIEKDRFYEIGQERGYGTPRTFRLEELKSVHKEAFPIAAKPKHRRVSSDGDDDSYHRAMDRLRLVVIDDHDALREFLRKEERWLPELVFQTYVPGMSDQMRTVGVYADSAHEITSVFTGRKIRGYPADVGDCIVGEAADLPERLVDDARRIVADLGLTGILEFEFKHDATSGEHVLIEVNPRSWSWVGITSAVGDGLPWTAYVDLAGRDVELSDPSRQSPAASVRYAKVIDDALNSLFRYRSNHPAWSRGPLAWWKDLHTASRVVYAEFQRDDLLVAFVALLRGVRSLGSWLMESARDRDRSGRASATTDAAAVRGPVR